MAFQPVWLLTDLLIYLLIAAFLLIMSYAFQREHLRAPLRQIRRQPMAMAALILLLGYFAIGLLDSFHFRLRLSTANATPAVESRNLK